MLFVAPGFNFEPLVLKRALRWQLVFCGEERLKKVLVTFKSRLFLNYRTRNQMAE